MYRIAELLIRILLFICDKRRTRKCYQRSFWQNVSHIVEHAAVFAAVRLVDEDVKLFTVRLKILISANRSKLVDKRRYDNIALVPEQCFKSFTRCRSYGIHSGICKIIFYLLVEVFSVGNDNKPRIFRRFFDLYLLDEHNHGKRLAAALGMPYNAALTVRLVLSVYSRHRLVYGKKLLMTANLFDVVVKEDKELYYVKQPFFVKKRNASLVLFNYLPVGRAFFTNFFLPVNAVFVLSPLYEILCRCA